MPRSEKYCPVTALRRLLLAYDGSTHSEGAAREAISLAKRCSSTLYVMSVIGITGQVARVPDMDTAEVKKQLEAVKAAAAKEGVKCETIIGRGDAYAKIVQEAEKRDIDLIIVGRRGLNWLQKTLIGSVVSKVIGNAQRNVLVVPGSASIGCKTVLVATDGSAHSRGAAIAAVSLAKRCGSRLIALSVMPNESERPAAEENANNVVEQARLEGVEAEAVTTVGKPYDSILESAEGMGADLIVMGAYGKTALKRFVMGSIVEKVVGNSGCAVLVVNAIR